MSRIIEITNAAYDDLVYQYELLQKLQAQTIKNHEFVIEHYETQLDDIVKNYEKKLELLGFYTNRSLRIKDIINTNKQLIKSNKELSRKCEVLQEVNSEASSTIIELERNLVSVKLKKNVIITNLQEKIENF